MRKIVEAVLAIAILVVGGSTVAVMTGALPEPVERRAGEFVAALGLGGLVATGEPAAAEAGGRGGRGEGRSGGRGGGRGDGPGGGGGETLVTAAAVQSLPFVDRIQTVGTGLATQSVTVATSVAGLVETVHFTPNAPVERGDPLVTLDRAAEAIALEGAKAQYEQAKAVDARYQQSRKSGTFSTAQLEEVRTALSVAEAALKQAQFEHDRRVIRAPFAGRVGLDDIAVGQHLPAGTGIVRLDDTSALEVEFLVPEAKAAAAPVGTPVRAMSLALPGRAFEGEVVATDSHLDPATRTLRVRALIPNPEQALAPGTTFSITVPVAGGTMPVVPALAVQWSREGAFVWRLLDGAVERVPVVIGKREGDAVYVEAALAEGDLVAVEGAQKLNEGSTVAVEAAPDPEGALTVEVPALRQPPEVAAAGAAAAAVQVTR